MTPHPLLPPDAAAIEAYQGDGCSIYCERFDRRTRPRPGRRPGSRRSYPSRGSIRSWGVSLAAFSVAQAGDNPVTAMILLDFHAIAELVRARLAVAGVP